jgi:hypothetical protein
MNNRQNGRRRGRGGQQARNGQPGAPDRGSRLDNRARGNAAQLLEKYKTLARDAQMQGDRVNTEYYLQFADHYFRVLSENRSRFEEQQQRRPRDDFSNDFGGDDESNQQGDDNDDNWDDGEGERAEVEVRPEQQPQRNFRPRREERAPREDRGSYGEANGNVAPREQAPQQREAPQREQPQRETAQREMPLREAAPREQAPREERAPRERRPRNANRNGENGHAVAAEAVAPVVAEGRIEIDLPPSISGAADLPVGDASAEGEARPRVRRPRRPRTEAAPVEA